MAEDYGRWLTDLSKRTGASVEQSDLERLRQTNPDDVGRLQEAYESQYARRGASGQTGSGMDDKEATARGYGSARSETADDTGRYTTAAQGPSFNTLATGRSDGGGGASPYQINMPAMPDYSKYFEQQNTMLGQMQAQAQQRQQELAAQEATRKAQSDQLYGTLLGRAQQSTNINAQDPIISGQVGAFRNEQERGKRNYLSNLAESAGPLANLRGEQRMAAERTGQATSGFQAELLGRELSSKRAEISDALNSMRGVLSADQQAGLQRELSNIDAQMQQVGMGFGAGGELGRLGIGFGGLQNDLQRALLQNQQFYSGLGSQEDQFRARLGFDAADRGSYWDSLRKGLL